MGLVYVGVRPPPIHEYGGNVEKSIGDAVLAAFSVPSAHEDNPELTVRAALGMQAALIELNEQLEAERDRRLAMDIAVNTGLVVSRIEAGEDFPCWTYFPESPLRPMLSCRMQNVRYVIWLLVGWRLERWEGRYEQ